MAFPVVESITQTNSTSGTTKSVDLPATVDADDKLFLVISTNAIGSANLTATADLNDWDLVLASSLFGTDGNGTGQYRIYAKDADGTEDGTSVDFTVSGGLISTAQVYRISGAAPGASGVGWDFAIFPLTTATQGFGRDFNPPSVTATWGSDDNLFVTGFICGSTGPGTTTTNPGSYTAGATTGSPLAGGYWQGTAWRQLAAASDDPSAFQINGASGDQESYRVWTIVFQPAAAGVNITPERASALARIEPTSEIILSDVPIDIVPVRASARATVRDLIIPQPSRPTRLELSFLLNGIWVDAAATAGVYARDGVNVSYGRANWSSRVDASRASMSLDNRDGRWSPDYDDGVNAGIWKRNIPVRVGVGGNFDRYLGRGLVNTKNMLEVADSPDFDVTDDIDLRFEFQFEEDLVPSFLAVDRVLIVDRLGVDTGFRWRMSRSSTTGELATQFFWEIPGVGQEVGFVTLPHSIMSGRQALRVVMDAGTGFVTFYSGPDADAGPWTIIGAPFDSGAGANSIAGNDRAMSIGGIEGLSIQPFPGKIFRFQMRDGIDGTVVADADLSQLAVGTTSWTDSAGQSWTVGDGARVTDMRWRFHGELASIPVRWNIDGSDVYAPIEAAGLFRRLRQGQRTLQSATRRSTLRSQGDSLTIVQYWPCEESGPNVGAFGAAIGVGALAVTNGPPKAAENSDFIASDPLPALGTETWTAVVDDYEDLNERFAVAYNLIIPETIPATSDPIMVVNTTTGYWELSILDAGPPLELQWEFYNTSDVLQFASTSIAWGVAGDPVRMQLEHQTGSPGNSDFRWYSVRQGDVSVLELGSAGLTGNVPGKVTSIVVNPNGNLTDVVLGHIVLYEFSPVVFNNTEPLDLPDLVNGHSGETAGNRIQRLCTEEGLAYRIEGDPDDSEAMGPQTSQTIMDLLEECAETDLGILHESRDSIAVAYRTRASMIGQTDAIELDYIEGHLSASPELDRDDQNFSNDVTLENSGGGQARAALDDGSDLSISEPPVGAGRYDSSFKMNGIDSRLPVLAQARLALSTVDEPRVSALRVSPHYPALRNDPGLTLGLLEASLGDLIEVRNNLPVALGTKLIRQLIQGTRDRVTVDTHDISILTTPASPWDDLNVASPEPPVTPPVEPDPPGAGTPAPTIPTFNSGSATTVSSGQSLAAAVAAGAEGDHFFVENGAICNNVNPKTNQHIRFAGNFVAEGSGIGYFIRPASQGVTGVVIGGDPNAATRAKVRNYGNGTSSQEYGAIMGRVDDALNSLPGVSSFIYQDVDDWFIYHMEFETNSSVGIKLGSNFTVYDCVLWGHTVNGINGDRFVGGLLHSCHFWFNALNPATGGASNGANVKVTWLNADIGRTVTTPIDRSKADFIVSNCTFDGLDQRVSPVSGDTNIGMWFDLDCQQFLVEYSEFNDHPNTSIFAEGCNNGRFTQNTVRRSNGFGLGTGSNFSNGAISTGESTNIEVDNNTLIDCANALFNRLSGRTDWLDPSSPQNYAYSSGPRYWLLNTTSIPAVSGQSNIYTGDNNYHDNVLDNCLRVVINEGINNAFQTVVGTTDLTSIDFADNDYSLSPSILFYEASNTGLSLAAWQALPRTRDNT